MMLLLCINDVLFMVHEELFSFFMYQKYIISHSADVMSQKAMILSCHRSMKKTLSCLQGAAR